MFKLVKVAERLSCSLSNVYSLKDQGLLAVVTTGRRQRLSGHPGRAGTVYSRARRKLQNKGPAPFPKNGERATSANRRFEHLDGTVYCPHGRSKV